MSLDWPDDEATARCAVCGTPRNWEGCLEPECYRVGYERLQGEAQRARATADRRGKLLERALLVIESARGADSITANAIRAELEGS